MSERTATVTSTAQPWWKLLNGYHWFVLAVASAAWCFDCLDQRLFSLARVPALVSLLHKAGPDSEVANLGKQITALFLIGWGVGGMFFGALGDRHGRAKMLTVTVLIYSMATGLSFFSRSYWDFALFRFLTGVGVGGVFGLAVALIAETVPDGARAQSLGLLQVLSTIGNLAAGFFKMGIDSLESSKVVAAGTGWRYMFLVGALPALMVLLIRRYLKEPEPWLHLKRIGHLPSGGLLAPYRTLLSDARWRKNLVIGAVVASTGVVGLWAIGEYAVDLQSKVFLTYFQQHVPAERVKTSVESAKSWSYLLNMCGAAVGMWLFTRVASTFGRRPAFLIGFLAALVTTFFVYWKMSSPADAYWMMPLMGAAQLSVFAGFAIYLPELFPSRVRSTGTSFCYNFGRFAAAAGSMFSAALASWAYGSCGSPLTERYSAMTMCAIFLVGILILPFAPETKGKPLIEE
ncbi:MAG TPA: MFS transporter [Verrucomicrobiaceae bacterium]|jgi:MFS family permease